MVRRKKLLDLIGRAHDALESQDDFTAEDIDELVEELAEMQLKLEDDDEEDAEDSEEIPEGD